MPLLALNSISKRFGAHQALDEVSLAVEPGEVVAINDALGATPGAINEEAEGKGWFFRLKLSAPDELNELMTDQQYKEFLATLE